ncbi:MAG: hypothetical protein ABEJ40_01800 [Haloarculaceae archaeon]
MDEYVRHFAVAVLVIAALSAAVPHARQFALRSAGYDATDCGQGTLTVSRLDSTEAADWGGPRTTYAALPSGVQSAFDRARSSDGEASVDPGRLSGTALTYAPKADVTLAGSALVTADGRSFEVFADTSRCPTIPGTPPWLNYLVDPLSLIDRAFGPLVVPLAAVAGIVLVYRRVDAWVRFD